MSSLGGDGLAFDLALVVGKGAAMLGALGAGVPGAVVAGAAMIGIGVGGLFGV